MRGLLNEILRSRGTPEMQGSAALLRSQYYHSGGYLSSEVVFPKADFMSVGEDLSAGDDLIAFPPFP